MHRWRLSHEAFPDQSRSVLHVRTAVPNDRTFVFGLAERFGSTRAAWRGYDEVVDGTRRQLGAAFDAAREGETILIVEDVRGEPCGFAYLVTHDDYFTGEAHGHLSELATTCDGGGAGGALLAAAEAWSRERGFGYLSLNVNDTNDRARRFYERRAYVPEYRHLVKPL